MIRKLKAAGVSGEAHWQRGAPAVVRPHTGKEVWVTVHGHDAGRLGERILKDAGVKVMTTRFPIVVEVEESGVFSAYVVGLPVYAQGDTAAHAERALRHTLTAYLEAHPDARAAAGHMKVASVAWRPTGKPTVNLVSTAALIGSRTSERKAASSRANGRLGGRPPRSVATDRPPRKR